MADILYCVAGGNPTTLGFLADIEPTHIDTCMRNNYYTAAYSAHSMFKLWIEDDKNSECPRLGTPKLRQIVFINSAAAFVGIPGYISYTSTWTFLL